MSTERVRRPIVVTHEEGVRFAARIRDHVLITDQPAAGGGADVGPAPLELLGASLGSCVALYVKQYCASRGLPYTGLRVEVDSFGASNPHRIGRFTVRTILPEGVPPEHVPLLERVMRSCPAHHTLAHGAEMAFELELPTPA